MTTPTPATTPTRPGTPPSDLLIDRYLPSYDVGLVEHTLAAADLTTTWRALHDTDLTQVHTPLMDAAMSLRGLPTRVAARLGPSAPPPAPPRLPLGGDGPTLDGWLSLGEVAEREIALGAVGQFWRPDIRWYDVGDMSPEAFAAFSEPGWGRIAADFTVLPYTSSRTLLTYEVRTATADEDAARQFARYWRVIRPFVAHIMRAALGAVRADAEARACPPSYDEVAASRRSCTPRSAATASSTRDASTSPAGRTAETSATASPTTT